MKSKINRLQEMMFRADTKSEKLFLIILIVPVSFGLVCISLYLLPIIVPFYIEEGKIFESLFGGLDLIICLIFCIITGILGLKTLFELRQSK